MEKEVIKKGPLETFQEKYQNGAKESLQDATPKKYFLDSDNFEEIIKEHLSTIKDISLIQTGWTNFVYKVNDGESNYIFRFPRNDFFSDALIKDYNFCHFIKDKITFRVPDLNLYYYKEKPYSMHKLIEGRTLSDCYNDLTSHEKEVLADDIANLIHQFANIDFKSFKNANFQLVSNFLDGLSLVAGNNYDITKHDYLKDLEKQKLVVSHGDLNPGNLILKDNKLVAVIDFAFAGVSNTLVDLSRMIGRTPAQFKDTLINAFEKKFASKIDMTSTNYLKDLWGYIEDKYILYIKQNHPSIVLPDLV